MNEHERIEQVLVRQTPPKAPPGLRAAVLGAIQTQRESESPGRVVTADANDRSWLTRLDRMAVFAAPCLLAISLLVFVWVDRSADSLYAGHRDFVSKSRLGSTNSALAENESPMTPRAFFRQHLALLQNLNAELFHEASKKIPQVDGDRPPFGYLRRDPDGSVSELASITQSRGAPSTPA